VASNDREIAENIDLFIFPRSRLMTRHYADTGGHSGARGPKPTAAAIPSSGVEDAVSGKLMGMLPLSKLSTVEFDWSMLATPTEAKVGQRRIWMRRLAVPNVVSACDREEVCVSILLKRNTLRLCISECAVYV
jgi:hypothetical protein